MEHTKMKAELTGDQARMQRVLDYIDRHLDEELDLNSLSSLAGYSKYHFHRQFTATFGLSLHRYVQLARLKRASFRLVYSERQSVTDIALDAGYEAPDAFARAFRQRCGQTPSSFRSSPDWVPWFSAFGPLENARSKLMQPSFHRNDVEIREVPSLAVAVMEHRGDPDTLAVTLQRFIAWRKAAGLHPKTHPTFTVWRSERRPERPADYSIDLCVGTEVVETHGESVYASEIPGGRCAVLRVVGDTHNLEPAALFLYRDWLPTSGEEARDFPIYCQRLLLNVGVPESESMVDLFLPLK